MISCMHTRFFIDHTEVRAVLAAILEHNDYTQREWRWPLGSLVDGHEFIALFQV